MLFRLLISAKVAFMFGSGSPPIGKPSILSHFYPDDVHVSNIKSNGKNQNTSNPNLFLSQPNF